MSRDDRPAGRGGGDTVGRAAAWTGLRAGIAVAIANVDAHVSAPAASVTEPGTLVAIMGTSTCHVVLSGTDPAIDGMCGVVRDGVVRGCSATRRARPPWATCSAGSPSRSCRPAYHDGRAARRARRSTPCSKPRPPACGPGESGLLALDWWNGNRSVLVDADLSGLLVGATMATGPGRDLPGADRGDRLRHARDHRFARGGRRRRSTQVVACGGLPERNRLLMQIYADITGRHVAGGGVAPGAGARVGDVRRGRRGTGCRRLLVDRGGGGRHGPAEYSNLPSERVSESGLRLAVRRLHDPARLFRTRRE